MAGSPQKPLSLGSAESCPHPSPVRCFGKWTLHPQSLLPRCCRGRITDTSAPGTGLRLCKFRSKTEPSFSSQFLQYLKNHFHCQPVSPHAHSCFMLHISLKGIIWIKKRKNKPENPTTLLCPGPVLGSTSFRLCSALSRMAVGERDRGWRRPSSSPSQGGRSQPTSSRSPVDAADALVVGGCSIAGLLLGHFC